MAEELRHDNPLELSCGDCGLEWVEHFSLPMTVTAFVTRSKAIICPRCDSKKIYLGRKEVKKDAR